MAQARLRFAHDGLRANWIEADSWLLDPGSACYGGFGDLAIHLVDLLDWWGFGQLTPEILRTSHILRRTAAEDHGLALLRLESGGTAIIEAGWASGSGPMLQVELLGSQGVIASRDGRLLAELSDGQRWDLGLLNPDAATGLEPFLDGVATGDWSRCVPLSDAVSAARLIDAIYACVAPESPGS